MKNIICMLFLIPMSIFAQDWHEEGRTYEYDNLNRLEKVFFHNGIIYEYKYDKLGNRLEKNILVELPYDNYILGTVGLTCVNSADGSINIKVDRRNSYKVQIVSDANEVNETYELNLQNTWELNVAELEGGEYYIYITINDIPEDTYKKTFIINLDEPEPLEVAGKISGKTYTISLAKGTPPFTIKINGAIVATTSNMEYSMEVAQGDVLEVSSSKQCEGVYSKILELDIYEELVMYPNPTSNEVYFNIPETYKGRDITISVFDFNSRLLNVFTPTISNSIAKIKIGHLPTGIYFIHIPALYNQNLKIIKE